MPHIGVKLLEGKTEEQKEKLAIALVKAAQDAIGYGDESYSVTIEDVSWVQWREKVYPEDIIGQKDILFKEPGYEI